MKCRSTIFCDQVSRCGFHKKHGGTCYSELVLLHLMGSAGHVVHSSAFGPQNIDALFFMFGWTSTDSTKSASEHVTLNFCFLNLVGSVSHVEHSGGSGVAKHRHTIFYAQVGPERIQQKRVWGHVTLNFYFGTRWDLQFL
jgi:hypothetical protein